MSGKLKARLWFYKGLRKSFTFLALSELDIVLYRTCFMFPSFISLLFLFFILFHFIERERVCGGWVCVCVWWGMGVLCLCVVCGGVGYRICYLGNKSGHNMFLANLGRMCRFHPRDYKRRHFDIDILTGSPVRMCCLDMLHYSPGQSTPVCRNIHLKYKTKSRKKRGFVKALQEKIISKKLLECTLYSIMITDMEMCPYLHS